MKTIGFLKEQEADILGDSISYVYDGDVAPIVESDLAKVVAYLHRGTIIFAMTLSLQDSMGNVIAPYEVLTDGEWLWPRYLIHYIKKGQTKDIPAEFYDRMKAFNYVAPEVPLEKEISAKKYFEAILLDNHPKYKNRNKKST